MTFNLLKPSFSMTSEAPKDFQTSLRSANPCSLIKIWKKRSFHSPKRKNFYSNAKFANKKY